jgi:polysaccharide chain length determinant protein (PEP-CTERM system associated)
MSADYQLTLQDYFSILKRRGLLMVVVFAGVFAIALAVAVTLPPVYRSTGTIMVESQQIPTDLVSATVTSFADERIEIIRQRVMTRDNLLVIANRFNLYGDSTTPLTPTETVEIMRAAISVQQVNTNIQNRQRATIAFTVSFDHRRPELAQRVTNELVTLFLNENVRVRTERAARTTEFLTQEADKLRAELETLETEMANYRLQHGGALAENVVMTMNSLQRLESELRNAERDLRTSQDELRALEVEAASARAGVGLPQQLMAVPSVAQTQRAELELARAELARVSSLYTANHPDVRSAHRRVDTLEQAVAALPDQATPAEAAIRTPQDLAVARIESRMAAVRSQIQVLESQRNALRGRIAQFEAQLLQAPQVERGIAILTRDLDTTRQKYNEVIANVRTAQMAESLEDDQKAERFSLLEPPRTPEQPVKPERRRIAALGFFLAIASSGGMAVMLEMLYGRVRGLGAVMAITGQRPLVIIPYIKVAAEATRRRRLLTGLALGVVAAGLLGLMALHFFYQPLDILMMKVLARLG